MGFHPPGEPRTPCEHVGSGRAWCLQMDRHPAMLHVVKSGRFSALSPGNPGTSHMTRVESQLRGKHWGQGATCQGVIMWLAGLAHGVAAIAT